MHKLIGFILLAASLPLAQTPPAFSADEISGMYTFLQEGEFVQINLEEQGRVTGFISRYGDSDSDRGAFLDHFINKGLLEGQHLAFETRVVHGVSFALKGDIQRGPAKTRSEDGYYIIKGTLTQYTTDAMKKTSAKSREVTFKSFPQDFGDTPKRN
jgi:hypothetical protein